MNREDWYKKLIADRGQKYFDQNKDLLDAQFEYIDTLGDPGDIRKSDRDDLIISNP